MLSDHRLVDTVFHHTACFTPQKPFKNKVDHFNNTWYLTPCVDRFSALRMVSIMFRLLVTHIQVLRTRSWATKPKGRQLLRPGHPGRSRDRQVMPDCRISKNRCDGSDVQSRGEAEA